SDVFQFFGVAGCEHQAGSTVAKHRSAGRANALGGSRYQSDLVLNDHEEAIIVHMEQPLLPLFPLNVVLFPRTPLPLHIFEERYKEMIAEAIESHTEFGVV